MIAPRRFFYSPTDLGLGVADPGLDAIVAAGPFNSVEHFASICNSFALAVDWLDTQWLPPSGQELTFAISAWTQKRRDAETEARKSYLNSIDSLDHVPVEARGAAVKLAVLRHEYYVAEAHAEMQRGLAYAFAHAMWPHMVAEINRSPIEREATL